GWGGGADLLCGRLGGSSDELLASGAAIWRRVLAHLVLSRAERRAWAALDRPEAARNQWLLGRIAAKDAVRMFPQRHHRLALFAAALRIRPGGPAPPLAPGGW